ncbi:unnamed protein product [Ectocarpus sp. 4 AP-2014]
MLQALRWRAVRHGRGFLAIAGAPRCASAPQQRFLAAASKGRTDPPVASTEALDQQEAGSSTATDQQDDPRHILLYEGSKRNVRISSSVTVVNGLYWSFYVGVLEPHLPTTTWEPWGYLGLGFTAIMTAATHTFARHWVSQISYLPDLRLLSIGTHNFFGAERMPRLVRLGGTVVSRTKPKAIYLTFKVRGDRFNSILDTADGVFHNREMLMRLLKASPNGEVADPSAAEKDSNGSPAPGKTKQKWNKRKRRR